MNLKEYYNFLLLSGSTKTSKNTASAIIGTNICSFTSDNNFKASNLKTEVKISSD